MTNISKKFVKMTAEDLFYEYDGNFGKQQRKAQKSIDNKSFKNLPFSEKVAFLKKNAPVLKVGGMKFK